MTRRRGRSLLRADVLAPWITLLVILLIWWVGAKTVAWVRVRPPATRAAQSQPRPSGPVVQSAPSAPAEAAFVAPPARAAISSETVISGDDVAELRSRDLVVPVRGVPRTALVSSFHDERGARGHEAMDMLAPRGTEVLAVEDGRVARLFTSDLGGLTIYQFDPSGEFCYYYAHLDGYAPELKEGSEIRRGQVIGYVGTTGNAPKNTPHLHFAIFKLGPDRHWWEGTPINPFLAFQNPAF